jgi:hypothetical protein
MLIFVLVMITFGFLGAASDIGVATALTFGIMIPTVILTFFFDTAAVFEDRRVFESIRRSIGLVSTHFHDVITFFVVCAALFIGVLFPLMILWEAFLYNKLEPITHFSEAQLQAFTPDQLVAMIGPEGMWITAVIIFIGVLLLLPVLYTYKACLFRKLASGTVVIQQQAAGEFDSKGRWYKY